MESSSINEKEHQITSIAGSSSFDQISQSFSELSFVDLDHVNLSRVLVPLFDDDLNQNLADFGANNRPNQERSSRVNVYNKDPQGSSSCPSIESFDALLPAGYSWSNNDGELPSDYVFLQEATTIEGSRRYVNELTMNDPEVTNALFERARLVLFQLMTDEFGCHVFAKLIEAIDVEQREVVVDYVVAFPGTFVDVALHRFGMKSVKKFINVLQNSPSLCPIINILSLAFCTMMTHQTGWQVIVDCVDILQPQQVVVLYQKAIENCLNLAIHEQGCISMKEFIAHSKGHYRDELLHIVCDDAEFLSYDPTGNYIVQNVLTLENPLVTREISDRLCNHYARLSLLKCGSHIVEKCLKSDRMQIVVEELISCGDLARIAQHKYGNYVIQTALQVTENVDVMLYQKLRSKLKELGSALDLGYAKNIKKMLSQMKSIWAES